MRNVHAEMECSEQSCRHWSGHCLRSSLSAPQKEGETAEKAMCAGTMLPRSQLAMRRAEDNRFNMMRANRILTTYELARRFQELESNRVSFAARAKHDALTLKMELLRRADEEKAILATDSQMMHEVDVKLAKRRRKRAVDAQQQEERRNQIRRQVAAKTVRDRFDPKPTAEDGEEGAAPMPENPEPVQPVASPVLLPVKETRPVDRCLDVYIRHNNVHPDRQPQIKLDTRLIYPNVHKPKIFRQLLAQQSQRQVSRINEKSLQRLREKYRVAAAAEGGSTVDQLEQGDTPYISSISHQMYAAPNNDREATTQRILRQISETREILRVYGGTVPASNRLKETLQECMKRKKKGRDQKTEKARSEERRNRQGIKLNEKRSRAVSEETFSRKSNLEKIEEGTPRSEKSSSENTSGKRKGSLSKESKNRDPKGQAKSSSEAATAKRVSFSGSGEQSAAAPASTSTSASASASAGVTSAAVGGRRLPLKGPTLSPIHSGSNTPLMSREATSAEGLPQTQQLRNGSEKVNSRQQQHGGEPSRKSGEIEGPGSQRSSAIPAQSTPGGAEARRSSINAAQQGMPSQQKPHRERPIIEDPDDPNFDPEAFKEVLNCRYIRGYEPPEMRVNPHEALDYIFGDKADEEANIEKTVPAPEKKGKSKEAKK